MKTQFYLVKDVTVFALLIFLFVSHAFARPEPKLQIETFFSTLNEKGGSAACGQLCTGTYLEETKGPQLPAIASQLDAGIKMFKKITRSEVIDEKQFGKSFVRYRVITYHDSEAPLFWEFMFYRYKEDWQIYVFKYNDQFDKTFNVNP